MQIRSEAELQKACVRWFDDNVKLSQAFLFSVPNGGTRHKLEAISLKKQGLRPGVSDLILLVQDNIIFLELNFKNGKQYEHQLFFEKVVNALGFNYYIIKSLEEFKVIVYYFIN
jgi:hypothetical protein